MPLKVLKYSRNKMENIGCKAISELIKEKNNEITPVLQEFEENKQIFFTHSCAKYQKNKEICC